METKICAMFRQSWYEAAKSNLFDADRLKFYEACFNYEFYGDEPQELPPSVKFVFDIIKGEIESDRRKALNRAETARQNGKNGGRPSITKDNETQQNPSEPNGLQNNPTGNSGLAYTIYNNNNNNKTQHFFSLYGGDGDKEKKLKFLIFRYFYSIGVDDALKESERYCAYYEARNWQINGQPIKNPTELAKVWKPENLSQAKAKQRAGLLALLELLNFDGAKYSNNFVNVIINPDTKTATLMFRLDFYNGNAKQFVEGLENEFLPAIKEWRNACGFKSLLYGVAK